MNRVLDVRSLTDEQIEREHTRLLNERDAAHNHLQHLNRQLDAVRAERMSRSGAQSDGEAEC